MILGSVGDPRPQTVGDKIPELRNWREKITPYCLPDEAGKN
ncbi:hypothetical protein EYZ11_012274 [Aspergillus tanneri]|uniref:Uncharacterized protein n=1 Tax=Aspergillus tanneri TaxID=1220188 RepID=A0A4S3J2R8_9EURO|nr:hypothetical protein EYZ11_012274 [Aspergillus tanneri]